MATEFKGGEVVARDLRGEVVVERVVSVSRWSVIIESSDGHTEVHPITLHTSADDILSKRRPATEAERAEFLKVTCWECGRVGASWCVRCVQREKVA